MQSIIDKKSIVNMLTFNVMYYGLWLYTKVFIYSHKNNYL